MTLQLAAVVIAVVLLVAGAAVADNYRGLTGRFALWAARTNSRLTRGRGPHNWLPSPVFQTVVFRVYGAVAAVVGLVLLSLAIHH